MNKFETVMQEAKEQAVKNNLIAVRKDASNNASALKIKITNHIMKHSLPLSIEDIYKKITNDNLIASFFSKDPGRQNIAEKTQLSYMSNNGLTVEKLPNSGKNSKFIQNGKVVTGTKKELGIIDQKSIDCIVGNVYCSLKYTKDAGGAQDNQKNDIINFVKYAKTVENCFFAAIVDGNYYTDTVIDSIKSVAGSNTFIGGIDEFIKKEKLRTA